jgi:hypothetical protein
MADFFKRVHGAIPQLDLMLESVGLTFSDLQQGKDGVTLESVTSFVDLVKRATAHWWDAKTIAPQFPQKLQGICRAVSGWPIFGSCPEETILRAAQHAKGTLGWGKAYTTAAFADIQLFQMICDVYAPDYPYRYSGEAGLPVRCSNYDLLYHAVSDGDAIISFNYDFLLDRVLEERGRLRRSGVKAELPTVLTTRQGGDAHYLKLHGSVLWYVQRDDQQKRDFYLRRDRNAGEVRFVTFSEGLGYVRGGHAPKDICKWVPPGTDGRDRPPLIVPPTLIKKDLLPPVIDAQWDRAVEALSRANDVYVIGYSFPESDTHIREKLTERAAELRKPHGNYEGVSVTIVTKPNGSQELQQNLFGKARDTFPGARVTIAKDERSACTLGFREWLVHAGH